VTAEGYDRQFYAGLEGTALPSARRIVPMLLEWVEVHSAVDLGCGDGSWLSVLRERGVEHILGLDGPWVNLSQLKIPPECFRRARMDQPVDPGERFDLALSLEVAEHLPPARAEGFVADLCALAPIVLFSAAVPDQGGTHHVNEQWPSYWVALFEKQGYRPIDAIRPAVWEDPEVHWWYRQNCVLFASPETIEANPSLASAAARTAGVVPALIHPELYRQAVESGRPSLKKWLRQGRAAFGRWLRKRSGQPAA
jgi:SAM-dependent methyltransferase